MSTHRTDDNPYAPIEAPPMADAYSTLRGAASAAPPPSPIAAGAQSYPEAMAALQSVEQLVARIVDALNQVTVNLGTAIRFSMARTLIAERSLDDLQRKIELMATEIGRIQHLPGNDPATAQELGKVMQQLTAKANALAAGLPTSTDEE